MAENNPNDSSTPIKTLTETDATNDSQERQECPICYDVLTDSNVTTALETNTNETQEDHNIDEECGVAPTELKEKITLADCGHYFCRDCLTNHCVHSVSVREIPIPCPATAEHNCETSMQTDLIQDILCKSSSTATSDVEEENVHTASHWKRFQNIQRLLQDPDCIECTNCQTIFSMKTTTTTSNDQQHHDHPPSTTENDSSSTSSTNGLTCPSCNHKFCKLHGDAHPNKSCEQYQSHLKSNRQIHKSERAIRKLTKPCSHCSAPIQKESGCDHIICTSCKKDMCFRCGTHLYLSGDVVRNCNRCQQSYLDHRHIVAYRFNVCLNLLFFFPFCILHIVLTGALTIITCCFCCCCCCCRVVIGGEEEEEEEEDTTDDQGNNSKKNFTINSGGANQDNTPDTKNNKTTRNMPRRTMKAIKQALAFIFWPIGDFARQLGISCCCDLYHPTLFASRTITEEESADDDDDDDNYDQDVTA